MLNALSEVGVQAPRDKGVNNVFSKINVCSQRLGLCRTSCCFYILKQVPIYFSCSGEHCSAVLLRTYFVEYKTYHNFPSPLGE